jgi:hypothetical protein
MPTGTQYLAIGLGAGAVYYGLRTIWRPNLLTVMDDDDSSSDDSGKNTDKVRRDGVQRWGGCIPSGMQDKHCPTLRLVLERQSEDAGAVYACDRWPSRS